MVRKRWIGLGTALLGGGPVQAECLGSCADDLAAALFSILVYGVIGIVLLVMLIRGKWRRAGVKSLAVLAILALGVPLVSQAWVAWKLRQVEAREVIGEAPVLTGRTVLLIAPGAYCWDSACEAVVKGSGASGTYVILTQALEGVDLSRPVRLADLPLQLWSVSATSGEVDRREVTASERAAVADGIDYLVVTTWAYYPADPGPVEAALRANPALKGMGKGEAVRLLLAPLEKGKGELALASLTPDVLDLTLEDRALAIPLAPRNRQGAGNSTAGAEAAARAICPEEAADPGSGCRSLLER